VVFSGSEISLNHGISKNLYYFYEQLKVPHAFQVIYDMPYVNQNCFDQKKLVIVPATTLLSQTALRKS